jgi:hypothetical protein
VNLTGESKNFKMLEFPLNQLQTYYGYLCDLWPLTAFIVSDLNYKMVFFLSQTESTPKHFFLRKKKSTGDKCSLSFDMSVSAFCGAWGPASSLFHSLVTSDWSTNFGLEHGGYFLIT